VPIQPDDKEWENDRSYTESLMYVTLGRLTRLTYYIQIVSMSCFLLLLAALLSIALIFLRKSGFPIMLNENTIILLSTSTFFANILCLLVYQSLRRSGDVLFAELSDELQWHLTESAADRQISSAYANRLDPLSDNIGRPSLSIRIALRSFVKNTGLPLVDGPGGTQIYFGVSAILWITSITISVIGR
jgi:hypothetical protein